MKQNTDYKSTRSKHLKKVNKAAALSLFTLSLSTNPAVADPFVNSFEENTYLSETDLANYYQENNRINQSSSKVHYNTSTGVSSENFEYTDIYSTSGNFDSVINLPKGADIFESALTSFAEIDTSDVDVSIAKAESLGQQQAYNSEIVWEIESGLQHSKSRDHLESITETSNDRNLKTSVSLRKTLWDKSIDYSIDAARNNIRTAQLNQFDSHNELIESVALSYLDFLAARDLVKSSQKRNRLLLNVKNKIYAQKESGYAADIDVGEVENEFQTAQISLLEEEIELDKAKIKLSRLTQNNNIQINSNHSYFNEKNDISLSSETHLINTAMRNNSELRSLNSNEVTLQKNILAKRAGASPKLDFTSSISQEWIAGDNDQDAFDISMGINMEMPLYTGGRLDNDVKIAKLELLSAEREVNKKKREIISDISTLSSEFSGAHASYKSLLKLHNRLKKNVSLINAAVASEERDNIDVFSALEEEFDVKSSLIRQYYNLLKIKVEIMKLTGDLDKANLNQLRSLLLLKRT